MRKSEEERERGKWRERERDTKEGAKGYKKKLFYYNPPAQK